LGLPDQLASPEGFGEVPGPLLFCGAFLSRVEGETGKSGEELPLGSTGSTERGREPGVEVEGAGTLGGEGVGEDAADSGGNCCRPEGRPAGIVDQIDGVEGRVTGRRVKARTLATSIWVWSIATTRGWLAAAVDGLASSMMRMPAASQPSMVRSARSTTC